MCRFYSLGLALSLWGEAGVVRQWGRIGSQGQSRTDWHANLEAAAAELERMAKRKRRRDTKTAKYEVGLALIATLNTSAILS